MIASTNTKKDASSIAIAPQPITPACFKIAGIAMLPIAEAPVRNLVALTHPLSDSESTEESDPTKNSNGMGRSTYIITVSVHHVARCQSTSSPITILLPPDIMLKRSCFQSGQDKYEEKKKF